MVKQRSACRRIVAVTAISLLCPVLMGPGCPGPGGLIPPPGDAGDGQIPGDTAPPTDGSGGALMVDAGPNRTATVGASILLCGTVTGGEAPYVTTWSPSEALADADTLTPTFTPPAEGQYTFTLTVRDSKGLGASRSVTVNALDHAALGSFHWGANFAGGGYQLIAIFTRPVDKATAENVNNYRLSPMRSSAATGEIVKPSSASLGADGRTATLLFTGKPLARDTRFDIGLHNGILGTDGVAVQEVLGLPAVANSADTQAPTITTRRWATGDRVIQAETEAEEEIWNDTGVREEVRYNYMIEVVFSETMDPVSVVNPAAYRIQEGEQRYRPTLVALANDGRTVTLTFQDGPLSRDSKLDTGLAATLDINGRALATEAGKNVAPNANDKTPPAIATGSVRFVEGVTEGGYRVTVDFNEPMDKASLASASRYQLAPTAASVGTPASKAELEADGRRLTLTFASGTFSTSDILKIDANTAKDINGVTLSAQTNLAVLPSEDRIISPGVPTVTWLPGDESQSYQIRAVFPVAMDKATVENPNNWRINNWRVPGTGVPPTNVTLSQQTGGDEVAGRTAKVTFDVNALNRWDTLDVSVGGAILDINSRPLEQVTLPITPSDRDDAQPAIARTAGPMTLPDGTVLPDNTPLVLWCDWGNSQTPGNPQYNVTIHFSEVLDGASAENTENYVLRGNTPTSATLLNGKIVVLEFASFTTPIGSTDELEMLTIIRDINGLANTVSTPVGILSGCDKTAPSVVAVNWASNPVAYQVAVQFSEAMDRTSTEFLAHWTMQDVDGIEQIPTEAALDTQDPTRLVLTFGAGVFPADAQLAFAGDVRDISGNTLTAQPGAWPKSIAADPEDHAPLRIVSAKWAADSMDGYVVLVQFSEPIDGNNPGTYTLDGAAPREAMIDDGGCTATLVFPSESDPRVFNRSAKLTASGIRDLSGDLTADDVRDVLANPDDVMPPSVFPFGVAMPGEPGTIEVLIAFYEVMDAASAQTPANYQISGTFIKPVSATLNPEDGMVVTLVFDETALPSELPPDLALDVSVGNSVYDLNGLAAPQVTLPLMILMP